MHDRTFVFAKKWRSGYKKHRIAQTDYAILQNPGGDAAVSAHGIVATRAKVGFHARAGLAVAGAFQQCRTDAETAVVQGEQVDATDYDVPAGLPGIDGSDAQ